MRIRKSRCIELNQTCCCTGKFNVALSLCGVLEVTFYFSKGFSEAATRVSAVAEASWFLGETMVCFLEQESSLWSPVLCYELKPLGLDNRITLVLSNIRELNKGLFTN